MMYKRQQLIPATKDYFSYKEWNRWKSFEKYEQYLEKYWQMIKGRKGCTWTLLSSIKISLAFSHKTLTYIRNKSNYLFLYLFTQK